MSAEMPKRYFELHQYRYDSETGDVFNMNTARFVGKRIRGYGSLSFEGKTVYTHRMVWRIVHGEWPASCIDHINGDRADNRLANLRLADYAENAWNRLERESQKGWFLHQKSKLYKVMIWHRGKRHFIGSYPTADEAEAAYRMQKLKFRGEAYV